MVVPESSINNIMGGLESTGGVTLHNHRRKLKQRFETITKLGQGTYGKVQLGINKETGQEVAIKTIKKCKIETEADLIRIRREIQIMSSLRHPYIIHIYEVFENRDKMVLVMEYAAGGELYDYLSKKKVLDEQEARRIFRQIAMAVYYCHKHQICHRDLKLENILLDDQGNAKIADFGLSNVFDKSRLLSTFCGSPLYASPEIVKGIPYYGPEVDCWSMGVLLYTLVYGAMPFDGSNFKRLVRQISAGEYFEPKTPSSASEVIAGLLTVKGTDRLDITGVCKHPWMAEEGKVSCYRLAVELAEQEPNRLDLLLALAPQENQIPSVPEEISVQQSSDKPSRSMSLSSLPTVQPSFTSPIPTPTTPTKGKGAEPEKPPEKEKEKKRERSSSRSRKKESDDEKPKKKTAKTKKKSDPELSREEMEKVLEEARRLSEIIAQTPITEPSSSTSSETKPAETPMSEEATVPLLQPKATEPKEEAKEKPKEVKKVKKVKQEKKDEDQKEQTSSVRPSLKKEKEVDIQDKEIVASKPKAVEETVKVEVEPKELPSPEALEQKTGVTNERKEVSEPKESAAPFRRDSVRRKSKVFETAEMFNKSPTQEKIPQKKVFLPGVKVSDAKAAFERKGSVSQESGKPDVSLASTINVNKLVQNELNKDDAKIKKENAVKVISHAISESGMNKASTLPRRKLSKPSIVPRAETEQIMPNTSVSQNVYPSPVPPPRPSLTKQDSGPKEHIIPIQIEKREDKPPPLSKQTSMSSRTSSISSIGRQDSDSSTATIGTPTLSASCEPIRKSPREVIIPIAVEGGGFITPSASTLSKISSLSEGEDDERASGPMRGFGLHSTRRRIEATDSLSSDEEDDNFEMLTAENLFSTLLSRVRNLTYRLNENEGRPTFPRLFNHSIFDSPSSRRRLTETKSFSEHDPTPWRKKRETTPSSTLPRGFTTRSFRRTLTGGDENRREGRPPPAVSSSNSFRNRRRSEDEVVEDFLATGKLSSLDRVRNYLEGLRRTNIEPSPSPLRRYLSSDSARPDYPPITRNRFSSLDGSALNNRHSFINEDRSHRLDEQKKTSQTQTDGSAQNGGHDVFTNKSFNGFSHYTLPNTKGNENIQRSMDQSCKIPRSSDRVIANIERTSKIRRSLGELSKALNTNEKSNGSSKIEMPKKERANSIPEKKEGSTKIEMSKKERVNSIDNKETEDNGLNKEPKIRKTKSIDTKKCDLVSKDLRNHQELCSKEEDECVAGFSGNVTKIPQDVGKNVERTKKTSEVVNNAIAKPTGVNECEDMSITKEDFQKLNDFKGTEKLKKDVKNGSRVNKAINSLRKKSEIYENQFSESKLLKRAVSLEDVRTDEVTRTTRASSLKPEGSFTKKESPKSKKGGVFDSLSKKKEDKKKEDREARIANLKRLDLVKGGEISTESTPTGDPDEESMVSATDNSDTWSSCDLGERLLDPSTEECVLERIRRKSFYHRFNMPKRQAYNRSMSNMERKRYY